RRRGVAATRWSGRWWARWAAPGGGRGAGMTVGPFLPGVAAGVSESRGAGGWGRGGGILPRSMWQPYPPYHDARYDPIWAVCQDLDMPIHVHSGAADRESYGDNVGLYVAEVRWWSMRPLWFLLWAGVFERCPRLKFVVTECGA